MLHSVCEGELALATRATLYGFCHVHAQKVRKGRKIHPV